MRRDSGLCEACDDIPRMGGNRHPSAQLEHQEDSDQRLSLMHRVAELADDFAGDSTLAFTWMQRALLESPEDERTQDEVERLAGVTNGWSVLANTYAEIASNGVADTVKAETGRKLARVYEEELAEAKRKFAALTEEEE